MGFIRKLPTQLVRSFSSTLEAARDAQVRVLCADASSEELEEEIRSVRVTLTETLSGRDGSGDDSWERSWQEGFVAGPNILCLNKADLVSAVRAAELRRDYPGAVLISALRDCEPLLHEIYRRIQTGRERMEVLIPHADYALVSRLYGLAEIHAQRSTESGVWMDLSLPPAASARYSAYRVS